jgi:hypothetical protein
MMSTLLPVPQCLDSNPISTRKRGLAHAELFPNRLGVSKLNDRRSTDVGCSANMRNDLLHARDKLLVEIRK